MNKLLVLCYAGLVASASAIVVDNYQVAEMAPSNTAPAGAFTSTDLNWGYVYNYNNSTAVAVDTHWILTAKHVGSAASFSSNGTNYLSQQRIEHPSADLALIRVDKALPGYYDLYTGYLPLTFEQDKLPVFMVGYGTTGGVTNNYWTQNGAGRGTKRWGSQEIDIALDDEFWMYFDENATPWEAGTGAGDSGGGVFYKEGDTWKLAGINVSIKSKPGTSGLGFDRTVAVSMPYAASWIADTMDTVPEPAAMGLMGIGTIGLFLARTKRRRKLVGRSLLPIRAEEPLCDHFFVTEEIEAAGKSWINDCQTRMQQMINASPLPAWMNMLHARYKALNKAAWRFIEVALERSADRQEAVAGRVYKALAKNLDAFLEGISWDRIVTSVQSARTKSNRALKKGMFKSLDAFLEMIRWDHLVSRFSRRK